MTPRITPADPVCLPMPTAPTQAPLFLLQRSTDEARRARGCVGFPWVAVLQATVGPVHSYRRDDGVTEVREGFYAQLHFLCKVPNHVGGVDLMWFSHDDLFDDGGQEGEYDVVP